MEIIFKFNLNGSHGTISLTRQQWEGLCKLDEEMQRYKYGRLELEELIPIPNIKEFLKIKLKAILDNTLEKFPQFTHEEIRNAIKHTFYHKYENFSFLWQELENVNFLTLEQIEAFIREEEFTQSIFDNKEI